MDWLIKGISKEQLEKEKLLSIISAVIYTERAKKGLSEKDFAILMHVSKRTVRKWESGTYDFKVSTLNKICNTLDINNLLGEVKE